MRKISSAKKSFSTHDLLGTDYMRLPLYTYYTTRYVYIYTDVVKGKKQVANW